MCTPVYVNRNIPSQVNQKNIVINLSFEFKSQFNETWILKRTEKIILLAIIYLTKLPSLGAHRIFENRLQFPPNFCYMDFFDRFVSTVYF